MKRLTVLCLISATFGATPATDHAFAERLHRFHTHYNRFVRSYLGCPAAAREVEQCDAKVGSFDYGEWSRAAKEARELFGMPARAAEEMHNK